MAELAIYNNPTIFTKYQEVGNGVICGKRPFPETVLSS
jgi:hypothetical protein